MPSVALALPLSAAALVALFALFWADAAWAQAGAVAAGGSGDCCADAVPAATSRPLIVGIGGGSGCGKTTLASRIVDLAGKDASVAVISTDNYYRSLSEEDHLRAIEGVVNFDRLEALDMDRLATDIRMMRSNAAWPVSLPSYDFVSHQRVDDGTVVPRASAVLVEGLFVLAVPELRDLLDVKLFAKDDVDRCLVQRLRRDSEERAIPMETALMQYESHAKPAFDSIIEPSSRFADLVVPTATRNERAAALVAGWIISNRTTTRAAAGSQCLRCEADSPATSVSGLMAMLR